MKNNRIRPTRKPRITARRPVVCWEENISILMQGPTMSNPLPHFKGTYHLADNMANYPYVLYHLDFTRHPRPAPRKWRMIMLENKYLRVMIAPELGGRIYSMVDKTTGRECFHCNSVVKYMHGGFGGLYAAGGKEVDYPQAHAMTNCRDREANVVTNKDGSVTVFTSELELLHRTQWYFSYTLEPEASYVREEFRAFNRHLFPMPFHFWNNAGVTSEEGSVFLYSEDRGLQHGGTTEFTYPMFRGIDLSSFEECPTVLGIYMYNVNEGLVGHYNKKKRHGVARWGAPEGPAGKKIWVWGKDTVEGKAKQVSISGDNEQYSEIQSGYVENQDHFEIMNPLEEVRFEEYWFPVKEIGEFQLSSPYGALAINPLETDGELAARIGFMAARRFKGERLEISLRGKKLLSKEISIAPGECVLCDIALKKTDDIGSVRVKLTFDGREIINFCKGDEKTPALLTQYEQTGGQFNGIESKGNTDVLVNMAKWANKMGEEPKSEFICLRALNLDPNHAAANQLLGIILCKRGLHKDAHDCFDRSATRDPYNGDTYYYMAVNAMREKNITLAKRAARQAVRSRAPLSGNFLLGMIALSEGDAGKAAGYLEKARALNMNSTRTGAYLAAVYRKLGRKREAGQELLRILEVDPTDHLAQWELARLRAGAAGKRMLSRLIRQIGHLHQPYIEMAADYMAIGENEEAAEVLRTAIKLIPPSRPLAMIWYYLGHIHDLLGRKPDAKNAFAKAAGCNRDFVFPFRDESFDVLRAAVRYNPKDSAAYLYLGMLFYQRRRFDEGRAMFTNAARLNPSGWVAQRNLGLYWFRIKNQPRKAEPFYDKMLKRAPKNYFILQEYGQLLAAAGKQKKLIRVYEANRGMVYANSGLASQLVTALIGAGQLKQAVEVARNVRCGANIEGFGGMFGDGPGFRAFKRYGDELMARGKYDDAIAMFRETLVEHDNFQQGPFNGRYFAEARYKIGICHKSKGEPDKAEVSFREALAEDNLITWRRGEEVFIWMNRYFQALAMKELGMETEGNIALDGFIEYYRLLKANSAGAVNGQVAALAEEAKTKHQRLVDTTFAGVDAEI